MPGPGRLFGTLLTLGLALSPLAGAQPLTPEKFVQLRFVGETALSPDGKSFAYTVTSRSPAASSGERCEVWLRQAGEEPHLLLDRSLSPSWSPDGKALALLEANEAENRLKVWWSDHGTWSVLRHASLGPSRGGPAYCWLPDGRIFAQVQLPTEEAKDALVVDSKVTPTHPTDRLVEWNPDTGATQEWLEGVFTSLAPSADGKKIATLKLGDLPLPDGVRRRAPATLTVIDRSTGSSRSYPRISDPADGTLRWSPDNRDLAVRDGQGCWWTVDTVSGESQKLADSVKDCAWVGGKLATLETDWKLEGKAFLPGDTTLVSGSDATLAVTSDQVVKVGPNGALQPLCDVQGAGTARLAWRAPQRSLPLAVSRGESWTTVDVRGRGHAQNAHPGYEVREVSEDGLTTLAVNPEHTRVIGPDGKCWAEQASPASADRLEPMARGAEADWLLLPPKEAVMPYPVVIWLNPGQTYSPTQAPAETVLSDTGSAFNAHLLTAQGYAVYFPSMGDRSVAQVMGDSLRSVRARNQLDAGKVAVMGQSAGAEAALSAASANTGLRAVVALNPFVEANRWRAPGHSTPDRILEAMHGPSSVAPPAGSVNAPVLLVSGETEEAQAGQFFAELYREGKPARLVRYRQEEGGITRADHVVHEWKQIYTWLERYLRAPSANATD